MNPRLALLQTYPFERLRALLAGVTPNPALRPIDLSIGEPKHPTPALIKEALAGALDGLAVHVAVPRRAFEQAAAAVVVQREARSLTPAPAASAPESGVPP